MKRVHVVGFVAVVWAALAALPAQAVVLRYTPKVGSTITYNLVMKGDVSTAMPALADTGTGLVNSTMSMTQKALSKEDNGTKVEMQFTGGTITTDISGASTSQQVAPSKAVLVLNDQGRVAQVVSSDSTGQAGQAGLPGSQDWGSFVGYGGFPEGDVNVGDTWTDEVKVAASGTMPEMNLQIRSRLVELSTYQGHKAAKISSTFSGPISGDLSQLSQGQPQQVQGTMSGTLQGNFTYYYDYEKSVYVQSDGRFTVDSSLQLTGIGAVQMKMQLTVDMKVAK